MAKFKYIKREWKNGKWQYTYPYDAVGKTKKPSALDKLKAKVDKAVDKVKQPAKSNEKSLTTAPVQEKQKVDKILKDIGNKKVEEVSAVSPRVVAIATVALIKLAPVITVAAVKGAAEVARGVHEVGEKIEQKITEKRSERSREEAKEKALTDKKLADQLSRLEQHDPLPELPVKTESTTKDEDMAAINPYYDSGKWAYRNNCSYCTAAYDLRQRGYDVEADAISAFDPPTTADELASWYDGEVVEDLWDSIKRQDPVAYVSGSVDVYRAAECLEQDMLRHGDGARGHLMLYWQGGGGHDVIWEVSNGKVVVRDCQTNEKLKVSDYMQYASGAEYFRTDNVQPNEKILETVRSRKKEDK